MAFLTIFTPTYNRANLLIRLYRSLNEQTCKDFEWIIIDDDSSDNTEEIIKNILKEKNEYTIKYYKQPHGGKHRAINKALKIAKGEWFFIVDSDDYLVTNAVDLIYQWVETIKNEKMFCGVSGLKISSSGHVWNSGTKEINCSDDGYIDAGNFEREKFGLLGDKAEVYKTDILRKHPFPEFENEFFVTESVCWNAIAADGYKIRWFNKPIYVCEYLEDGLTQNGANEIQGHINNYKGYLYYIIQCRKLKSEYQFILDFSDYEKTANFINISIEQRSKELGISVFRYLVYKIIERPIFLVIRKLFK